MNFKIITLIVAAFFAQSSFAEMGVPIQLRLKSPSGAYPTEAGLSFKLLILTPTTNCILREESFSNQSVVTGNISLNLGSGTRGVNDPGLTLNQVYDNSKSRSGLSCVDASNNVISIGQSYAPATSDQRVIRITTTISGDPILVNFNMRSTPYAIQAESVGGKSASDLVVNDAASQMNQTNLNDLLLDTTRLNNLKNIAISGQAVSAASAVNFTGALVGDVSGSQAATVVNRIKGVPVSAVAPSANQVLQFNGSEYAPATLATAPVISVAGRTGAVVLSSSDISGLGSAAALNVGSSAGTVAAGDDPRFASALQSSSNASGDVSGNYSALVVNSVGGKSSAQISGSVNDTAAATALNVVGTLVKRDASGNVAVGNVSSVSNSTNNIYLFDTVNSIRVKAPAGLATNYILTLPVDTGTSGQVLQTDGAGNLSWSTAAAAGVSAVTASAPILSSGGANPNITISQSSASSSGYLSSGDWSNFNNKQSALGYVPLNPANDLSDLASVATARTNLGLGGAAVLNVGTTAGSVAAGDDARFASALQSSAFNAYVASAGCTTSESLYWNSVSSSFACQAISFPAALVSSVAGRTGAVVLSSSDISGLGAAAALNVGTSAGTVAAGNDARFASALQNSSVFSGDVSGAYNAISVNKIRGIVVSATAPTVNQVLQFNGSQYVPVAIPSAPVSSVAGRTGAVVLSSSDISGLGAAAALNLGTSAGTVAAGNDARFASALQSSAFNGYVASAACTTSESLYWNSVSSSFACQAIAFPADAVSSVAGRTGDVLLVSSDISGLPATISDVAAATDLNTATSIVKRDAVGGFSSGSIVVSGDITVSGSLDGIAKKSALTATPTSGGTTTAYTLSYGAATDAQITSNVSGTSVSFNVNVANTGAATLAVAGAPAASLISAFTGAALAAGDLQVGTYTATFNGTNWVVNIPPRRFKPATAINWTVSSATTIIAAGVNVGDYANCSFTNSGAVALTTANYWRPNVLVRAGKIDVVAVKVGAAPAITGISCLVQK